MESMVEKIMLVYVGAVLILIIKAHKWPYALLKELNGQVVNKSISNAIQFFSYSP